MTYNKETMGISAQVQIQFKIQCLLFFKLKSNFLLSVLSIDALFTPVGSILKKQKILQHKSQISIWTFFFKKKINLDFHTVISSYFHKDLSIHALFISVDLDEAKVISFLGVRTDTRFWNPHNYRNMLARKKFQLKIRGEVAVDCKRQIRMRLFTTVNFYANFLILKFFI